jgi:hypothetical protein
MIVAAPGRRAGRHTPEPRTQEVRMRSRTNSDLVRNVTGAIVGLAVVAASVVLAVTLAKGPPARPVAKPTPKPAPAVVATASPAAVATDTVATAAVAAVPVKTVPTGPSLEAYRGLGSWVDIYDAAAWKDPAATVRDMSANGVRTLFVETANFSAKTDIVYPDQLRVFIAEAHARHMYVVAWYLPNMSADPTDYRRVVQAIDLTTADGQRFDSFALDIESSAVKPDALRNQGLATLSAQIRSHVGPKYPLGAIIPSPYGLSLKKGSWNDFPYQALAQTYDVFVPMDYYTYHDASNPQQAYDITTSCMRVIRAQPGCATTPVHMIGGIAENSTAAEVQQFVRATRETGCIGASLYGWPGTTAADLRELAAVSGER